jgi:RNA polymerase sigma-70 factor (ECF subfamily)
VAWTSPHPRAKEFEEVAIPHLDALFNFALKLTHDRKDAEDLVQETFLRAYRFFDTYEAGTQIKAWLFRILRNAYINRYRAARIRPEEVDLEKIEAGYERMIDEEFLRDRQVSTPEEILLEGVLGEEVEQAMASLPEEFRAVVTLALVEDLSYREIAAILGIPAGTVMSRLHRGRKLLQAALLEYARAKGILRRGSEVRSEGERSP